MIRRSRLSFLPSCMIAVALLLASCLTSAPAKASGSRATCNRWTPVPSPGTGTPTAYLAGVGGSSERDVWAVGHRADYSDIDWQPLFRHWDGASWTPVTAPSRYGRFYAVATISHTDAWAVGEGPIIAHWNGARWRLVNSPRVTPDSRQPAGLFGIAALSATNVWAVGFNWHYRTRQLIEHWNGRRWRVIPGVRAGQHPLFGIAAVSATDIWAVGNGIEHWNGSTWTLVPSPAADSSVTAVAPDDIWAAGGDTIERWNGATWSIVPSPSSGDQFTTLRGITALSAADIWAVGYAGHTVPHDGYLEHPFVEHWNGSSWSVTPTPVTGSPDSQLLAVTAVSSRTIWAVGFAGKHRAGNVHSLIERYVRC